MSAIGYSDPHAALEPAKIQEIVHASVREFAVPPGGRVLAIIPDATRSFEPAVLHALLEACPKTDLLVATGTHRAMTDDEISKFVDRPARPDLFSSVAYHNHSTAPAGLDEIGVIGKEKALELSGGHVPIDIEVTINKLIFEYDLAVIVGPVFPHEVIGMSGGYKYLFPGISGMKVVDETHWLGALIGVRDTIGRSETPVRRMVEYAGAMVQNLKPVKCLSLVIGNKGLQGLWGGDPVAAHRAACPLSQQLNIFWHERRYHRVVAQCTPKYQDLWTAGKLAYKTQEVVAEGGEIVMYAPHLEKITPLHPDVETIGYHCLPFFLQQWDKYKDYERSSLAHSTHVAGPGLYEGGAEKLAARRILVSKISPERCAAVNLEYLSPDQVEAKYRNDPDTLWVEKAGEQLMMTIAEKDRLGEAC
jgi:nickel-dependent lactate racemase